MRRSWPIIFAQILPYGNQMWKDDYAFIGGDCVVAKVSEKSSFILVCQKQAHALIYVYGFL